MANVTLEGLKAKLSPKQILAAELLLENEFRAKGGKKTYDQLSEEIGCGVRTLYEWRQEPEFVRYLAAISDTRLDSYRSMADAQLVKLMNGTSNNGTPSIKALELFYKIIGKLVEKREVVTESKAIPPLDPTDIQAQLEALQKSIK